MRAHSILFLSCTVLWTLLPIQAGVKSAKGKGPVMTQRILFHPAPTPDWVKGLQVETLGRLPKGTWMAVDDATALELLKRDKSTLMLFPTGEDYREFIQGLDEKEVAEAVAKKHALVAADPKSYSLPFFSLEAMGLLSASASGSNAQGEEGKAMREEFRLQLSRLRIFSGGEDDGGAGPISLLDGAFDPQNELNWEEEALRKHVGGKLPPLDPILEKSRRDLALALELGMRRLGAKYEHEPTGRVWAGLERGVYATPLDEKLVQGIRSSHEPVLEWKGGFVVAWKEFEFDHLPMKEKKKQILYFDADVFRAEHMSFTRSQLRLRFAKRASQPLEVDAREYLARLKLDAILNLWRKVAAVARFDKPLSERMTRQVELESESLRHLLAAYPIWRKEVDISADQVRAGSEAAIGELEFWNAWAARNHWHLQQEQLEGYLAALRKP